MLRAGVEMTERERCSWAPASSLQGWKRPRTGGGSGCTYLRPRKISELYPSTGQVLCDENSIAIELVKVLKHSFSLFSEF